jgi:hypothetical protein
MAELENQSKVSNFIIAEFSHKGRTFPITALFCGKLHYSLTFEVKTCVILKSYLINTLLCLICLKNLQRKK